MNKQNVVTAVAASAAVFSGGVFAYDITALTAELTQLSTDIPVIAGLMLTAVASGIAIKWLIGFLI